MSARVFDCPQCGAPVTFRAASAVFAVCEHCRAMVVVRGVNAESLGVMAELPPDLSPFQIGTHGEWKGRGFEIMGRIRVGWDEGSWNEWCLLYDAKTIGWLAEAQGLLMISFETALQEKRSTEARDYTAGQLINVNGTMWTVSDVKNVICRAGEGELPYASPPQHQRTSIDLTGGSSDFASIELSDGEAGLYVGEYADFHELKLANLRPVPGWNAEVAQEKNRTTALSCPACGAVVNLRAAGQSMTAVCGSCGVVIDMATPELQVIQKADIATRDLAPLLPLGQRGRLFGVEYEVIGMLVRTDQYSKWSEYLLFNPWEGFRWLVFYRGHWSFVDRLPAMADLSGGAIKMGGRDYQIFDEGTATVTGVLGEFYWKVRRGERAKISDYIAPPRILSKEAYPDLNEFAWSLGEYVEPRVIEEAFGIKHLPEPEGVYLNQPNPFAIRWREIYLAFFVALLALIVIHIESSSRYREVTVITAPLVFTQSSLNVSANATAGSQNSLIGTSKTLTTPHFRIDGEGAPVTIEARAPVNNNWLDLDLDLVNVQTNASFPAELEVSYYHGADEDGPWSEGSDTASVKLSAIPPGEYFLAVEPTADPQIATLPFTVRVRAGGVFTSNFIVMLGLVLCYPGILLWRRYHFERTRWADSDFTPYQSSGS